MNKPWYKSIKTTMGVIFSGAVLVGGIIHMINHPEDVIDILELWAVYAGSLLGITGAMKLGHKIIEKPKTEGK